MLNGRTYWDAGNGRKLKTYLDKNYWTKFCFDVGMLSDVRNVFVVACWDHVVGCVVALRGGNMSRGCVR